jgi:hypothetical protein
MARNSPRKPSLARVCRRYHPGLVAVSALAQVYERLLPSLRRSLGTPPSPTATDQGFNSPPRRAATRPGG